MITLYILQPRVSLYRRSRHLALIPVLFVYFTAIHSHAANELIIPAFDRVVIDDDQPERPWYKMVGDLTGDGQLEAIVAGQHGPLVMYRAPKWETILIAESPHDGGVRGSIADMNGNGRNDIIMGSVVWLENPGFQDGAWQGEWTVHRIDNESMHDVLVGDLTGNSLLDVVGRDQSAFGGRGNAIYIYYQREPNVWEKQTLDCNHGEGIALADISGDGRLDIIAGNTWFKNASGEWVSHVFASEWEHPHAKVEVGDVNGNGRLDIVLTPAELAGQHYRISWFESPEGDKTQAWTEHIIVEEVEAVVHALALADFNLDGALDVAYAEMHQGQDPDEVVVLLNRGDGESWEKVVIDREGSHDIIAADLTGNGAPDLFGANHAGHSPVVIWENRLAVRTSSANPVPLDRWTYIQLDDNRQQWGDFADPSWNRYFGLDTADVTGNGALDIVAGRFFYRNPGGDMTGEWVRIDLGLNVDGCLFVDVEGAGELGIIGMAFPEVYWLKANDPLGDSWTAIKIAQLEPTPHVNGQGFATADLTGNGRPEILFSTGDGAYYLEIPDNPTGSDWPATRIAPSSNEEALVVGDINGNGWLDVAAGYYVNVSDDPVPGSNPSIQWNNSRIAWWENPGDGSADWKRRTIGAATANDRKALVDLNGNGWLDLVVTEERWGPGDQPNAHVWWFVHPGEDGVESEWERRLIVQQYSSNNLNAADMNGNGHVDLIIAEHKGALRTSIFINDGQGNFTRQDVDQGRESHLGARVADMNGNGAMDIVSIGWDAPQYLHLWRNDGLD